jgi:PhoPQ-activated pathogenicity-related protein
MVDQYWEIRQSIADYIPHFQRSQWRGAQLCSSGSHTKPHSQKKKVLTQNLTDPVIGCINSAHTNSICPVFVVSQNAQSMHALICTRAEMQLVPLPEARLSFVEKNFFSLNFVHHIMKHVQCRISR